MEILVFGATGSVGRQVVKQAIAQGHTVTAFARTPQKLTDVSHPNLTVFQGDVLDLSTVEQAMPGHDAVICVLGSGKKLSGNVRSAGTKNIIHAMEQTGTRRLICQSTLGAGDSWSNLNFYWKYLMFSLILRRVFADHQKQEQYVKQSHLDWTIVRPGAFIDGHLTGQYHHGFSAHTKPSLKISRADVADFLLKQLSTDAYLGRTPGVSY